MLEQKRAACAALLFAGKPQTFARQRQYAEAPFWERCILCDSLQKSDYAVLT
jgi:hypothetical protein